MKEIIKKAFCGHSEAQKVLEAEQETVKKIASLFIKALKNKKKIIFVGNGGSAADAQHLAAELVGRFKKDRSALASIALSVNTSIITAIANDFGYPEIFSRQVEALGRAGDVFVGISTSGNSENILKAVCKAKELGLETVAFCGSQDSKIVKLADLSLAIPIDDTPRIQEMHILAGHIICEIVENEKVG